MRATVPRFFWAKRKQKHDTLPRLSGPGIGRRFNLDAGY